jgi:RNA polymerase sigma-70 factor, ECF subfamily
MSTPHPGRALTFPIAWEQPRERERTSTLPEAPERVSVSDEQALVRLQSQDGAALELLFDRYARLVYRIARGVLRDSGEAEDVVQEAFFHLYKKASLFDSAKGTGKNWILQVALHKALDRKAHLARRGFYVGTDVGVMGDTLLGRTDLDREIGSKFDRVQLEKAFEELPRIQRMTLELFYFEGLELREISERLNEPLGNTRHHFYRGLERMRKSVFVQKLRATNRC